MAESLLQSLDFEEDFSLSEEWVQEIRRRCEETDSGKAVLVDGETVFSQLRKKISFMTIRWQVEAVEEVNAVAAF